HGAEYPRGRRSVGGCAPGSTDARRRPLLLRVRQTSRASLAAHLLRDRPRRAVRHLHGRGGARGEAFLSGRLARRGPPRDRPAVRLLVFAAVERLRPRFEGEPRKAAIRTSSRCAPRASAPPRLPPPETAGLTSPFSQRVSSSRSVSLSVVTSSRQRK